MAFGKSLKRIFKKHGGKILGAASGPFGLVVGHGLDVSRGKSEARAKAAEAALGFAGGSPADPNEALRSELRNVEQTYGRLPESQREALTEETKRAGVYSGTGEFQAGFGSELQARLRGARLSNVQRQRALQEKLGLPLTSLGA